MRRDFFPGVLMELAGLEPATPWVRSSRPRWAETTDLQDFHRERLECRNTSRNNVHAISQSDESFCPRRRTTPDIVVRILKGVAMSLPDARPTCGRYVARGAVAGWAICPQTDASRTH